MNLYKAFGLTIESSIELPEMLPLAYGIPDVTVKFDTVDTTGLAPDDSGPPDTRWWQITVSDMRTLFGCRAGVYEITDGSCVTIDPEPDTPMEILRMFLLGSALGAIQIQRGRVPLHGGAIVSNGHAIIITGSQGAGKSTLTSALVHNGFKYLTDDVSSVELNTKVPIVHSAYPQRKLVRDACIQMGFNPETLPLVDSTRDKFAIRDRNMWQEEAVPLGKLVDLVPIPEGNPLTSERIYGHTQFKLVMQSLYRIWMHTRGGDIPPAEFKKILSIAAALETYRVYVPRGIDKILNIAGEFATELQMSPNL